MATILITGARGGIGLNSAKRLLSLGHTVYVCVHHAHMIPALEKRLAVFGDQAKVVKLDVLDSEDRKKVQVWKIDILINNAAVGNSGPLAEIPMEKLKEVFETNVFAAIELAQLCIPHMIDQGFGKIIFLSSLAGLMTTPYLAPYTMTKHTIENVGLSLRQELKPFGIDVSLINPGGYHTGFNQKNFAKKIEWFDSNGIYKEHLHVIQKYEKSIESFEHKSTDSIAKQIVKAVQAKKMKRRYYAPWYQWFFISLWRRMVV